MINTLYILKTIFFVTLALIIGKLITLTFEHYVGSALTLATFHACFIILLILALPKPRLYFYTFFAGFIFLGFWPKVVMQTVWQVGFIDPVGSFSGSPQEWDSALTVASASAAGLVAARLVYLSVSRYRGETPLTIAQPVPDWYARYRKTVWAGTIFLVISINALNLIYAFYQVGVNPKIILPFKLNVPIAWLVNVGLAFWIASLVHWERLSGKPNIAAALFAPIIEALFSSICMLSRLVYLLHTAPYWIALVEQWKTIQAHLSKRKIISLVLAFFIFFFASVYSVFWLRVNIYYYIPPEDSVTTQVHRTMAFQLPHLFLQRWIGLEGVLVVGGAPDRSPQMLEDVIRTDPALGVNSLFQRLAKVHYHSENPEKFTFLANAGVTAILLFSGSLLFVFAGMMLLTTLLIATELVIKKLLANDFFQAISGATLANVIAQTTFPYLSLIFYLQLCVAVFFLYCLQRLKLDFLK